MKVSKQQVAVHRRALLDAASHLCKERGLAAVAVADISRAAGLTHGGFYRHFASREDMLRAACAHAFEWSLSALDGDAEPAGVVVDLIDRYLSVGHRDRIADGCPVAALAVDAARGDAVLSAVFADGIERYIANVAALLPERHGRGRHKEQRMQAMATLATLVGGMILARATAGARAALSEEILGSLRKALHATKA